MAIATAVQNGWPLFHVGVEQAFVRAPLDFDVYLKRPSGCGSKTAQVVRLNRALYVVKQAGRQWAAYLFKTMVDEHDMEQCKSDPCVIRKVVDGVVKLIVVIHVDDILVEEGKGGV